jgi:hypothetical protein
MTNTQLYLAIGLPILVNTAALVAVYTLLNTRFTDMRDLWRAELRRVEEVLDARLKHIEELRR